MGQEFDPRQHVVDREDAFTPFEQIQTDARLRILDKRPSTNLWIEGEARRRGATIEAQHQKIEIERDTVVVFADDDPLVNWGHPCRYLLYDLESNELYRTVEAQFPPHLTDVPDSFRPFHCPVVWGRPEILWPIWCPWWKWPWKGSGQRYAILFSGASNNRHTNDLEFLYRVLANDYGFDDDKIYVLNYDGTVNYSGGPAVGNWPGDVTPYQMTVNGAGTKSEFENVIDDLKGRIKKNDRLLIHTNNHGGRSAESYLCTYSGPNYGAADFAAKVGELPPFNCLIVMMEQCYAGGFNQPIIDNSPAARTSVASAAIATQTSIGGANFDPFARDWIAAMHKAEPSGMPLASNPDTNGNGRVTAREAYDYANLVHDPWDTPNYSESSLSAGGCHLGAFPIFWPYIWLHPLVRKLQREEIVQILENARPDLEALFEEETGRREDFERTIERSVRQIVGSRAD